ncbi:MAG TPA: permease-like cell division protein FtsX [Kofleriaceae bacterium]
MRTAAEAAMRGARSLGQAPLAAAATCAAVAAAFALLATTAVAAQNVSSLARSWSAGSGMIVYLADGAGEARAREIAGTLETLPAVERVTYVPPERGLERLRELFAQSDPLVARDLEAGLVPASLEVELAPGALEVARAHPMVQRLERSPGVDEVVFAGDWLGRVEALSGALERAGFWVALLVALACAWVLSVTLRLRHAMGGRQGEARTWDLVGASGWLVRGPRMVEGALLGGAGAAAGVAIAWALYDVAREPVMAALGAAFGPAAIDFLPAGQVVRLIAFGAALGAVAGLWRGRGERIHALA